MARFKRILLKLSGESLMGKQGYGIDPERLGDYARQIKEVSVERQECVWRTHSPWLKSGSHYPLRHQKAPSTRQNSPSRPHEWGLRRSHNWQKRR